jgi:carbon monoxide dehydrogenase subunit G
MTTRVEKTITVDVPVSTAYNQWTQFEDFPEFMGGVQQVEQLDDLRLRWVAEIGGVKREWYATILEQRVDEKVAWAATEGATNAGAVYFTPTGAGQTLVRLELEYEPEGAVEKVGDALNIVDRQAQSDLDKFKAFIESRHDATGAWRGDIEGRTVGTPGVESATSQGDSGKAGVSGKAVVAGVAAVAAGAAAVAATRSGSEEESDTAVETDVAAVPPVDVVEPVDTVTPVEEVVVVADVSDTAGGPGDQALPGDDLAVEGNTPGVSEENDGRPQGGAV